jgi:hypothetical protein
MSRRCAHTEELIQVLALATKQYDNLNGTKYSPSLWKPVTLQRYVGGGLKAVAIRRSFDTSANPMNETIDAAKAMREVELAIRPFIRPDWQLNSISMYYYDNHWNENPKKIQAEIVWIAPEQL